MFKLDGQRPSSKKVGGTETLRPLGSCVLVQGRGGALHVRHGMLIGRKGATNDFWCAFMNRWAPRHARGAVFSKKDDKVLARGRQPLSRVNFQGRPTS